MSCDINPDAQTATYPTFLDFAWTRETWVNDSSYDKGMRIQSNNTEARLRLNDDYWTGNTADYWANDPNYSSSGGYYRFRGDTSLGWDGKHAACTVGTDGHVSYVKGAIDRDVPCRAEVKAMPGVLWEMGNKYFGGGTAFQLTGTMKAVRAYNRVLSDDEIAQNYKADVARFDGALVATNVVVAASDYNGALAADAYEVFGTHVFTASASAADGSAANCVKVWTFRDGEWVRDANVDAPSYTYVAGTSPATVKIEFGRTSALVLVVR